MSAIDYEAEVIECLRRVAFAGSDRAISRTDPLTEGGLGLDSMALVELFVDLEQRFEVEIFETEWFNRGEFTLQSLIQYLQTACAALPEPTRPPVQQRQENAARQ